MWQTFSNALGTRLLLWRQDECPELQPGASLPPGPHLTQYSPDTGTDSLTSTPFSRVSQPTSVLVRGFQATATLYLEVGRPGTELLMSARDTPLEVITTRYSLKRHHCSFFNMQISSRVYARYCVAQRCLEKLVQRNPLCFSFLFL